jgi:hypothetical protein
MITANTINIFETQPDDVHAKLSMKPQSVSVDSMTALYSLLLAAWLQPVVAHEHVHGQRSV